LALRIHHRQQTIALDVDLLCDWELGLLMMISISIMDLGGVCFVA
jgi:hypothetical protein